MQRRGATTQLPGSTGTPSAARRRRRSIPPTAALQLPRLFGRGAAALAVDDLLDAVAGTQRGLATPPARRRRVAAAVDELARLGAGTVTTGAATLSATWRLLWTTEKETLAIVDKAPLFGTSAGEVYQVVDLEGPGYLGNAITFPPDGAFVVDGSAAAVGPQRCEFRFSAAALLLPGGRRLRLPPVGKGWFDSVYADARVRVARDSRGDTLVVARDGPPRRFG